MITILNMKRDGKYNLCGMIRKRLIELEIEERQSNGDKKYFYTFYENQPL